MLLYLLSVLGLVPTFQKTKCKRLLKTTMERIKLLEKRRQARLRQLYRDVVELRKLGKEEKLQSWVARIWKELCLFSVYTKIEDYCQSVQANLKEIAVQKECPIGLEEPLAGLCFAASCCADLPELQELREIFGIKYGKNFTNSAQKLQPNCCVNQQFLECLCVKEPSETRRQELLEEIPTEYNSTLGVYDQGTQQQDTWQEDETDRPAMQVSEVQEDGPQKEELQGVDVMQGSHTESIREEDVECMELGTEPANRKRSIDDRETSRLAFKRASRRKFHRNRAAMEGKHNGHHEEHDKVADKDCHQEVGINTGLEYVHHQVYECSSRECITAPVHTDLSPDEEIHVLLNVNQQFPPSLPPQRPPPPPPPPKRAPPPLPSLRAVSMPSFSNEKQAIADTAPGLPLRCPTMANNYFLETYRSHVHPRLPSYEDVVANLVALKR